MFMSSPLVIGEDVGPDALPLGQDLSDLGLAPCPVPLVFDPRAFGELVSLGDDEVDEINLRLGDAVGSRLGAEPFRGFREEELLGVGWKIHEVLTGRDRQQVAAAGEGVADILTLHQGWHVGRHRCRVVVDPLGHHVDGRPENVVAGAGHGDALHVREAGDMDDQLLVGFYDAEEDLHGVGTGAGAGGVGGAGGRSLQGRLLFSPEGRQLLLVGR